MATASTYEEFCRISKGLYTIVNWEIGQESEVRTRRQEYAVHNIFESFNSNAFWTYVGDGSKAEGFAFESSDIDVMAINKNVLVIDHELQNALNTASFPVVLLMVTNNTPSGFTLLKCLKYDRKGHGDHVVKTILPRGDSMYMSSEKARQFAIWRGKTLVHGPCRSGTVYGIEYDCAFTLKCPFWPKQAHSFIHRSINNGLPTTHELSEICSDGCLLVPVSSKRCSFSDSADLEWRISFALAEKKLVCSMNHCQFLCYGLMKIFLNEVLKGIPETQTENGNVLCSYFMKTAVFWDISECGNDWSDRNFLNKFLNVFCRVIKWVEEGYCPNFFIPENNMFYGKIYGRRQKDLMLRLRSLYDEDILCISRCKSLGDILFRMLNDRFQSNLEQIRAVDIFAYSEVGEKIHMLIDTYSASVFSYNFSDMTKLLRLTASMVPKSAEMLSAMKLRINFILQMVLIILTTHDAQNDISNKLQYLVSKRARSLLRNTKISYCLGTIFQAVISHMNGEYNKTIQIVHHIHQRLQNQLYTYLWDLDPAIVMGCRQQGMSHEDIVKFFIIDNYMHKNCTTFTELALESTAHDLNCPSDFIPIPSLVFLYFIQILSYTQLNKPVERNEALDVLHSVMYHDNNHHIQFSLKAISWEIMGICQQLCGDYVGAYQSYTNALNDEYNDFKKATIIRILILLFNSFQDLRQ